MMGDPWKDEREKRRAEELARDTKKYRDALVGKRVVDVYMTESADGGYCPFALVLDDGTEISFNVNLAAEFWAEMK